MVIVASAIATGAGIADAGVPAHGGSGPSPPKCSGHGSWPGSSGGWWRRQMHSATSRCAPTSTTTKPEPTPTTTSTTTTTMPPTTTTTGSQADAPDPPFTIAPPSDPTGSGGSPAHLAERTPVVPAAPPVPPPAFLPTPVPDEPSSGTLGFDDLLGNPAGIPFPLAMAIGLAGLATVGFVLRGTFGRRRPPIASADDGESLRFR